MRILLCGAIDLYLKHRWRRLSSRVAGRQHWWLVVRSAISAGLVTFLLATADVGRVAAVLAGAKPLLLLGAAGLFFLGMLLFAYRWRLVLAAATPTRWACASSPEFF